jgi:hypothetical protein
MKSKIQMVVASTLVAAMLSFPSTVLTGQYSRVQAGPGPVCPGTDPCVLSKDAPHAGPGPVCPGTTGCAK